jgi:two-component system OmpR family response regulator/two-component system alkaline phosphatase synthesis response regulator PhoP
MTDKPRILIVDDEDAIRSALSAFLGRIGFSVMAASSGEEALKLLESEEPALVLLDVVLDESGSPHSLSGLDVLRRLRQRPRFIPVIMLTSYPEWQVESLGQGAIAFVTKPWDNNALASQMRATLAAVQHIRQEAAPQTNSIRLPFDLLLDMDQLRVSRGAAQLDLTPIEFALLAFFARNPNRVFTREELLDKVWGYTWAGYARTVDRHIAALRRKLGLDRDELIETVHGVGYRLIGV